MGGVLRHAHSDSRGARAYFNGVAIAVNTNEGGTRIHRLMYFLIVKRDLHLRIRNGTTALHRLRAISRGHGTYCINTNVRTMIRGRVVHVFVRHARLCVRLIRRLLLCWTNLYHHHRGTCTRELYRGRGIAKLHATIHPRVFELRGTYRHRTMGQLNTIGNITTNSGYAYFVNLNVATTRGLLRNYLVRLLKSTRGVRHRLQLATRDMGVTRDIHHHGLSMRGKVISGQQGRVHYLRGHRLIARPVGANVVTFVMTCRGVEVVV